MKPLLSAAQFDGTSIPMLAVGLVGVIVTVFWIFFPVVVWGKLNDIIKLLREIRDNTETTANNTRTPGAPAKSESAVKYRIPGVND